MVILWVLCTGQNPNVVFSFPERELAVLTLVGGLLLAVASLVFVPAGGQWAEFWIVEVVVFAGSEQALLLRLAAAAGVLVAAGEELLLLGLLAAERLMELRSARLEPEEARLGQPAPAVLPFVFLPR